MAQRDYTLDDCAAYDYPAAIDKVIEVTKQVLTPISSERGLPYGKDEGARQKFY